MQRIIVGMCGATGAVYGIRLLRALKDIGVESHLIVSKWARQTIEHETGQSYGEVCDLASVVHASGDMGAAVSSGSFLTDGMVIAPCSTRTVAAISHGIGDNLIHRAADVVLKERRRLILMVRESPLSELHLENMLKLSRLGAVMMPPMPAFYNHPKTLDGMVDQHVARVLDQLGLQAKQAKRWDGIMKRGEQNRPSDE